MQIISLETAEVTPADGADIRRWQIAFYLLFLGAFLARFPFYATHHIMEDAYITFRSAFHLADFGKYAYNLGSNATGITSTLYGPYVAAIRLIFHDHAIAMILVLNTLIFLAGAALFSFTFFTEWPRRMLFFAFIAMLPSGLYLSYAGMEIPLQVGIFCASLFTLRKGCPSWMTLLGILLLPLVRPDAIAYSLILAILVFSFNRKYGLWSFATSMGGEMLVLICNRFTTGSYVTATMHAKEITYHPHHGLLPFLKAARILLFSRSYLLPVETKVLTWASPAVTLAVLAGCIWALYNARNRAVRNRLLIACFAAGVLPPMAYMLGGVTLFPWYFWTSNWLCYSILCYALVTAAFATGMRRKRFVLIAFFAIALLALDGIRLIVSFNSGTEEYKYRASVGRWIHQVANPGDTLELEPAGYIPFYAGIRTYDEVGLVSPLILQYRVRYGTEWWIIFLKQEHPTWLVERSKVLKYSMLDSVHLPLDKMPPKDIAWFHDHYQLAQQFHYSPADYIQNPLLLKVMKYGTASNYNVYRYTGPQ